MTHHEHKKQLKIQRLEFYQHSCYASPSKIPIFSGKLPLILILSSTKYKCISKTTIYQQGFFCMWKVFRPHSYIC